ncbi:MAG: hypothetical protein AAF547_06225 [Actinomycetota bacterium]
MTNNPHNRFPLQPLIDHTQPASLTALADQLGVEPRTIYRWRAAGLSIDQADRTAIALDSHPAIIWPEQWLALNRVGAAQ